MSERTLLEMFIELNSDSIDEEGIRLPNSFLKTTDEKLVVMALDMSSGVTFLYQAIRRTMAAHPPRELVFGFDRFAKPDQGTTLGDLLSVHHFDGKAWRFGVMEYRHEPRLVLPVNWSNEWWGPRLADETAKCLRITV